MKCQICSEKNLIKFLDLGKHPPPLNFVTKEQKKKQKKFPLQVFFCNSCGLVQLGDAVDPNLMFKEYEYTYTSGISTSFKNHLFSFAESLVKKFHLNQQDLVIDIASNDGTLLKGFFKFNVKVLGVEPSNVAKLAIKDGIHTVNDFFNEDVAMKIKNEFGKAKIITATNVFAHVDKLDSLMKGIKLLLDDKGAYVSESQYLLDIVNKLEYDTIYHEHLRYYGLKQLVHLLSLYDMDVFDAERISEQGGSIRVFACHKGAFPISNNVKKLLEKETEAKISSLETMQEFAHRVQQNKEELTNILNKLKADGKKIVGISAPARSSTILNYCEINSKILDYIVEKSTLKIGKLTPGTHIKVVDDNTLPQQQPDYALLLSWHMRDILIPKMKESGFKGKFIIPLPKVEVL